MNRTHYGQHQNCFGCHLQTLQFATGQSKPTDKADTKLSKDLAAYNRLRMQGFQPRSTQNCAELETRANTAWEVEHSHLVAPEVWRKMGPVISDVQQGMQEAKAMKVTPQDVKKWRDDAATT